MKRRIEVLHDAVQLGEIAPEHLSESDMVADPCTKYLPLAVWARHTHYHVNDALGRAFGRAGWKNE